jgi:hypothetical protein
MTPARILRRAREALRMSFDTAPRFVQDEIGRLDREIGRELKQKPTEVELKAAAFDHLMHILEGHHRRMGGHTREKRRTATVDFDPGVTATARIETEEVGHWEWSFRINAVGAPDLRKLLLDEQRDPPDPIPAGRTLKGQP